MRSFVAGPGLAALFDAPWLPLHLLVIAALDARLGLVAALGAAAMLLLALAGARLTKDGAEATQQRSHSRST
jgi:ABC-type protease/lipase transport system fused ATPase/permease subunit